MYSVSGQIVSDDMEILPYANIYELGTNNSTQTDANGKFSFAVQGENSVLKITSVGYTWDTVPVKHFASQSYFELYKDTNMLDEVVVTPKAKPVTNTDPYRPFLLLMGGLAVGWLLFSSKSKSKPKKVSV